MTEFETASLILRGLVGAGQIGVVAIGIMVMRGMNRDYTRQFGLRRILLRWDCLPPGFGTMGH